MKFMNQWTSPLGLPHEAGTVNPKEAIEVTDERVFTHPVVINWIRAGRLVMLPGDNEKQPFDPNPDMGFLKVLDLSIPKVTEALPGLTDMQLHQLEAAEIDNKNRSTLTGDWGVFAQEWERRNGASS